ncbi:hypothetical protein ACFFIX_04990 [Metabacillus herbersteinensis]|uniref:Small, acid-soluble spore protein Tlp n=1 Tax=Metabacillus herbersteinensis TaxID=283816 RepID=A0ABV6GBE4_9BACI
MIENNSKDIRQIVQKAKDEDDQAKNATDIVNHAISEMNPQRSQEDKSQNHR